MVGEGQTENEGMRDCKTAGIVIVQSGLPEVSIFKHLMIVHQHFALP